MINTNNKLSRLKANLPFMIILFALYAWGTHKFYSGSVTTLIAILAAIPLLAWIFVFSDLKGFTRTTQYARNFAILSFTISWAIISTITWYFNLYGSSAQWAYNVAAILLFFVFAHIAANRKYNPVTE